ncbi:MAG: UDP-N-acetylglucosamine 1-carboxyvinyltransferase [Actinomycetota bacterium]|nr:UDP-N-acetylglucosamine 1-carboxyvinyltransferase [Actinomycetota bacterium]
MERFIIKGGHPLVGRVKVCGAKNAALKLMAASILSDDPVILKNVPKISDVLIMADVLRALGLEAGFLPSNDFMIKPTTSLCPEAPFELVNRMRASIIVLGPLLAKLGRAQVALPGGCNIGLRKIDYHLRALEELGAEINVEGGFIKAKADGLVGKEIDFEFPSVGATENILMAAVMAKGKTVIKNAAKEPEIVDLISFLNGLGAKIEGAGGSILTVEGVSGLGGNIEHRIIPDRIEAGTFMVAAAMTGGDVIMEDVPVQSMEIVIEKLKEAGASVEQVEGGLKIGQSHPPFRPLHISTLPYPGFPTDMQAQMMTLLTLAQGSSVITENVFEDRFILVPELVRMGADISIHGPHALIKGVPNLSGVPVRATDLRGGAALVLAALAANGTTEVMDISHIDRGYEEFEGKLKSLGAEITRSSERESITL